MGAISNTFGTSTKLVQLIDPGPVHQARARFSRPMMRKLALANSLYVPFADERARGFILLAKSDFDSVRSYGSNFQLTLQGSGDKPPITFNNLSIVTADCVTAGLIGASSSIYLVELTDGRGVLSSPWFAFPTNAYYNVSAPAYPGTYYANSLNSGVAWTWDTMVGNIWNQMSAYLGTYTGLPSTPLAAPMNFNLDGVPAWSALCRILQLLGMGVACDLTSAKPYSIVETGGSDSVFDALVAANPLPEDDKQPIDVGAGRVPGTVIVYFRRINQYYGTEETVRSDSNQWATGAVYPVSIAAPAFFAGATGTGFLWDDFQVRYDVNNTPLAADVTAAAAIAAERVQQFFDDIYSRTLGRLDRTYAGLLPFRAGSNVDGVRWYEDYSQGRGGWRTQIVRGNLSEIWPGVYG